MPTIIKKPNKQVKIVPLEYPSNRDYFNPTHIQKLNKIQEEYKGSLFVFVDSSRSERMPAALGGAYLDEDYTSNKDSILGQLEKNNKKIKIATYQYAKTGIDRDFKKYINKTNRNFLPKYTPIELKDIDAILLNPSIERKKLLQYTAPNQNWNPDYSNWRSAPHDDRTEFQTKEFQDIVLHFANQMKKSYNKRLRNEIKR